MKAEIIFICNTFDISTHDLARSLSVAPSTMERWRIGIRSPKGTAESVIRSLHSAATILDASDDDDKLKLARSLVLLGIGGAVFHLLTKENTQ